MEERRAFVLKQIDDRIKRNKNVMLVICGETGSGKSYCALRLGEMLDPTFTGDRVVFDVESFVKLLNTDTLRRGQVIVFDEAGVGMSSKEWFSLSNRVIAYILQTFRHEGLITIFTTPDISFIDSQARKLFHSFLETKGMNRQMRTVLVKWLNLQNNARYGKIYYKRPRYSDETGMYNIGSVRFHLPSKELIEQYEKNKYTYAVGLRKSLEEDLSAANINSRLQTKRKKKWLEAIEKEITAPIL